MLSSCSQRSRAAPEAGRGGQAALRLADRRRRRRPSPSSATGPMTCPNRTSDTWSRGFRDGLGIHRRHRSASSSPARGATPVMATRSCRGSSPPTCSAPSRPAISSPGWSGESTSASIGSGISAPPTCTACSGWRYALPVGLFDVAKGAMPVAGRSARGPVAGPLGPLLLGVAAVVGHVFSVFVRFRGGKGVATAAGVVLGLAPWALLVAAGGLGASSSSSPGMSRWAASLAAALLPVAAWLLTPSRPARLVIDLAAGWPLRDLAAPRQHPAAPARDGEPRSAAERDARSATR